MDNSVIERIREIRSKESSNLPESTYLRTHIADTNTPIVIRNYQIQGILNLLYVNKNVLGFDTGLGKTLTVLSTIGYIWEKEPDFVPLVLVTKSALFQWESECNRFMKNMEPVVVHGEPHKRNEIYKSFFCKSEKKKILILTYDSLFRDLESSIIKDKGHKAKSSDKKLLKELRAQEKSAKESLSVLADGIKQITDTRSFDESEYVFARTHGKKSKRPPNWSDEDESILNDFLVEKNKCDELSKEVTKFTNLVSPPLKTDGLLDLMDSYREVNGDVKYTLILDEVHKIKNHRSQLHEKTRAVSLQCERIIGMTATPVKNRLMEFFGIFRIVEPKLFPKVMQFQNDYCVTKLQRVPGGRQVPIIVGYKNLDRFVDQIEPYYFAKKKQDVAKELPDLISVEVICELSGIQDELYDMAENGVQNDVDDDDSYADVLSSLVMCQQAVNAPQLILDENGVPFEGASSKIDTLLEFLEGDADQQKVIIFSRFEKMISQIEHALKKNKIEYVRITGKENNSKVRQDAREKFQDPNSGVNVIMITMAGSESLNLQAAEHFVFIDMPWSFGDHQQLIGRMIRIGSSHKTVVAHYYVGVRLDGSKTIDHHVLRALLAKKRLSDKVSGESAKGTLDLVKSDSNDDFLKTIFNAMKEKSSVPNTQTKKKVKNTKVSRETSKDSEVTTNVKDHEIESISIDLSDL